MSSPDGILESGSSHGKCFAVLHGGNQAPSLDHPRLEPRPPQLSSTPCNITFKSAPRGMGYEGQPGQKSRMAPSSREFHMASPPPPPDYASLTAPFEPSFPSASSSSDVTGCGLPTGFFLLRQKFGSPQRVFDVIGRRTAHGSEIGLHPAKQPKLWRNSTSLQNSDNNQVLYLDWNGQLTSASADRPIDCVDGGLIISHPRALYEIPSRESHPLPRFSLDSETSLLHVVFSCDPSFPGGLTSSSSRRWTDDDYIVEAVSRRRLHKDQETASIWAAASSGLFSGIKEMEGKIGQLGLFSKLPVSPFMPSSSSASSSPEVRQRSSWHETTSSQGAASSTQLGIAVASSFMEDVDEIPVASTSNTSGYHAAYAYPVPPTAEKIVLRNPRDDRDSDNEDDSDSDPEAYRPLRVIRLAPHWREKLPSAVLSREFNTSSLGHGAESSSTNREIRKWKRRQWEAVPVAVRPVVDVRPTLSSASTVGSASPVSTATRLTNQDLQTLIESNRPVASTSTRNHPYDIRYEVGQYPVYYSSSARSASRIEPESVNENELDDDGLLFISHNNPLQQQDWEDARNLPSAEIRDIIQRNGETMEEAAKAHALADPNIDSTEKSQIISPPHQQDVSGVEEVLQAATTKTLVSHAQEARKRNGGDFETGRVTLSSPVLAPLSQTQTSQADREEEEEEEEEEGEREEEEREERNVRIRVPC